MIRTRLKIPRMDCVAEETLARMAFSGHPQVRRVDVRLAERQADVFHEVPMDTLEPLGPLRPGAAVLDSTVVPDTDEAACDAPQSGEAKTLRIALAINGAMFLGESMAGLLADSSALIADSLDMFADAAVYGIALFGAGQAVAGQRRAARVSGWMQLALGCGAAFEVVRRMVAGSEPESSVMIGVAAVALAANAVTMRLLVRHRGGGAHMRASWIFTTNDVLANFGVIVAGVLVRAIGSAVPDLVVGGAIALVVLSGSIRILRLPS